MRDMQGSVTGGEEHRPQESLLRADSCSEVVNCVFLLGPTAVGKTAIGVRIAAALTGEILSADSRQVYKGLDVGSGKDIADYTLALSCLRDYNPALADRCVSRSENGFCVPYHLIDVTTLSTEYNLFDFQEAFYAAFSDVRARGALPVVVGGTGLYLDCILRGYDLVPTPPDSALRAELAAKSYDELRALLIAEKPRLHNTTDFADKERIIHALEIERYLKSPACAAYRKSRPPRPVVAPLVLGTRLERGMMRARIAARLRARLDGGGLVEEVERLHAGGVTWARLEQLGLEYRFVSAYLQGKFADRNELFEKLHIAIGRFAKRQETWFRGMERKGVRIHWLPETPDVDARAAAALNLARAALFGMH